MKATRRRWMKQPAKARARRVLFNAERLFTTWWKNTPPKLSGLNGGSAKPTFVGVSPKAEGPGVKIDHNISWVSSPAGSPAFTIRVMVTRSRTDKPQIADLFIGLVAYLNRFESSSVAIDLAARAVASFDKTYRIDEYIDAAFAMSMNDFNSREQALPWRTRAFNISTQACQNVLFRLAVLLLPDALTPLVELYPEESGAQVIDSTTLR